MALGQLLHLKESSMKRFLIIFLIILLPSLSHAGGVIMMGGGVAAAAAGCSTTTEEVGLRGGEAGGTLTSFSANLYCMLSTASCSGTLDTIYIYHQEAAADVVKVCIYDDAGSSVGAPDATDGNVLSYCSTEISSSLVEWASQAVGGSHTVAASTNYWVCIISDATEWKTTYNAGSYDVQYRVGINYTTPPANLYTGFSDLTTAYDISVYITIGP
jgi:hypothetical protein